MATNLFKDEANRQREVKEFADAWVCVGIIVLLFLAICYIGYRAAGLYEEKEPIKNHR